MMMMVLLFLFHFSDSFPLKGAVRDPGDNTINTINTINTTRLVNSQENHNDTHTSSDMPTVSVIVGVSAFITLLVLSFKLWRRPGFQAGGILGSLIHYPARTEHSREPFYIQKPSEIPC